MQKRIHKIIIVVRALSRSISFFFHTLIDYKCILLMYTTIYLLHLFSSLYLFFALPFSYYPIQENDFLIL